MIKKTPRQELKNRRHRRSRKKVAGTQTQPRLAVFKSEKQIYVQFIDDDNSTTLASASSLEKEVKKELPREAGSKKAAEKEVKKESGTVPSIRGQSPTDVSKPIRLARIVGQVAAKKALERGITKVVFDRGGYKFHGRIKAVAEGAREAGLKF